MAASGLSLGKVPDVQVDEPECEDSTPRAHRSARKLLWETSGPSRTKSGLLIEMDWDAVRTKAVLRVSARLGLKGLRHGSVTPTRVHRALTSLGCNSITLLAIESWLLKLKAVQAMPKERRESSSAIGRVMSVTRRFSKTTDRVEAALPDQAQQGIPQMDFCDFVDVLLSDGALGLLEPESRQRSLTIREVLFCGDANRLVAELTHVRVDDVAAPMEKPQPADYAEPFVGLVILLNGVFIGAQASAGDDADADVWFYGNIAFTAVFVLELCVRVCFAGPRSFFLGMDRWWNFFDAVVVSVSLADVAFEGLSRNSGNPKLRVMRTVRLSRLTRCLRIFRLQQMKELSLMVRGLIGGLRTLVWAVVLLFLTLYVIGVMATSMMGDCHKTVPKLGGEEIFVSVPQSIFTAYRCFMGDCTTSQGWSIVPILASAYGPVFALCYFAGTVFVVFGLFNLIVAIYIENTLNAAKAVGERGRVQRQREAVRIARLTRQLVKRVSSMQALWKGKSLEAAVQCCSSLTSSADIDDVAERSEPVSKEMFLCLVQDAKVQQLLDELDVPSDRAALFDILDSDGSGGLEVTELITGLLQVRGEPKKCDMVGTLLAVRTLQKMLLEQGDRLSDLEVRLETGQAVPFPPKLGTTHAPVQAPPAPVAVCKHANTPAAPPQGVGARDIRAL